MAGRQSAGLRPLGHSPFGKEKLEGPKKRHDNHGPDASVPGGKNLPPSHAWERQYDITGPSANMVDTEGSDFNPKRAKNRKTTHIKVNETDY